MTGVMEFKDFSQGQLWFAWCLEASHRMENRHFQWFDESIDN